MKTVARQRPGKRTPRPEAERLDLLEWLEAWLAQLGDRLPGARGWAAAFVAVWLALCLWRFAIIASPPYWDSAMGLFVEAEFLARSNFDYGALANDQRRFIEGGSAVYIVSVMPTLLAAAMKVLPSTEAVLVAGHLFNFAVAASLLLLLYAILRQHVARVPSLLVCGALATTPLLAAQIDMIGMDLPMTLLGLAVLWFVLRGQYAWAGLASLASFLVKISGGVTTAALIVYFGLLIALGLGATPARERRRRWVGLGTALVVLGLELLIVDWTIGLPHSEVEKYEKNTAEGMMSLGQVVASSPDLIVVGGIGLAVVVVSLAIDLAGIWRSTPAVPAIAPVDRAGGRASETRWSRMWGWIATYATPAVPAIARGWRAVSDTIEAHRLSLFCWIAICGTLAVLAQIYTIPRYLTLPLALLWASLALLTFGRWHWRRAGSVVVAAVIAFNVLNLGGRFYPPIDRADRFDARTGALLERSLEYLDDHRQNIALAQTLEEQPATTAIVTANPFVHFLSMPALGYVSEPLHGYSVNTYTTPMFKPIHELRKDPPQELIFVWAANRFVPIAQCAMPSPQPDDLVLYPRTGRATSLAAFEKRLPPGLSAEERKRWQQDLLWPGSDVLKQADELAASGNIDGALVMYQKAVQLEPLRFEARAKLAALLARENKTDAALEQYDFILDQWSDDLPVLAAMADVLTAAGRFDEAEGRLAQMMEKAPNSGEPYRRRGMLDGRRKRFDEAERNFRRALELNPKDEAARLLLGHTLRQQDRLPEAIVAFEGAVEQNPKNADALAALAETLNQNGQYAEAAVRFQRALALRPNWTSVANSFAWLLATCPEQGVRDGREAARIAEAVRDAEPANPYYLDTLAAAYAENGRYGDAERVAEQALALTKSAGNAGDFSAKINERLQLYRAGKPYRQSQLRR